MSFTAVIRMTGYDESPQRALQSIANNKEHFSDVVIVNKAYSSDDKMYQGYAEDKAKIQEPIPLNGDKNNMYSISVKEVPEFDVIHCNGWNVIEIPPYCEVKRGALDMIQTRLKTGSVYETHMGVTTATILPDLSPFYGFLVVAQVIGWFWNRVWERNKLYQYTDLRVTAIIQRGKKRFMAPSNFMWRLWNNGCIPVLYGGDGAISNPPSDRTGWDYVMWTLYTHQNFGFGLWIFPYSVFWITLSLAGLGLLWGNITSLYILGVWFLEFVSAYLICQTYMKIPFGPVYYLFFPLYWMAFPFVLLLAKNTVPQRAWRG